MDNENELIQVTIRLPLKVKEKIDNVAKNSGCSTAEAIRRSLDGSLCKYSDEVQYVDVEQGENIKYVDMIQYTPKDVVTLAGSDYTLYYNKRKESWIKARYFVAKNGGKSLNRLFREAVSKMESGELFYNELAGTEYRRLLFEPKYMRQLKQRDQCVREVAEQDYWRLHDKIVNGEITVPDEITAIDEWKLAYMCHQENIEIALQNQKAALIKQNCDTLCSQIANKEITSMDEIRANEYWKLGYEFNKNAIGVWCSNHKIPYKWR